MKQRMLWTCLIGLFLAGSAQAGDENIYKRANNQADYVILTTIKEDKAEEMALNHPYSFTVDQMEDMLRSLRYSRKSLLSDKEKIRNVFEWEYIKKYSPFLVEAFQKATPFQIVSWSVVQKRPLVIIRNDRLTQVQMWMTGKSDLHIKFEKTEAKLQGDYQAHTTGDRLIESAKGLRISLEPQQGQKFAFSSNDELILDINANWQQIADAIQAEDERMEEEKQKKKRKNVKEVAPPPSGTTATPVAASPGEQKTAEQRLVELKRLKDKGLISAQDYEKKKAEILQGL